MRGAAVIIFIALVLAGGYAVACRWWPFAPCSRCNGTGKLRGPFGRTFRLCPRCKGTGRRLRLGRRLANQINRTHTEGTPR